MCGTLCPAHLPPCPPAHLHTCPPQGRCPHSSICLETPQVSAWLLLSLDSNLASERPSSLGSAEATSATRIGGQVALLRRWSQEAQAGRWEEKKGKKGWAARQGAAGAPNTAHISPQTSGARALPDFWLTKQKGLNTLQELQRQCWPWGG